MSNRHHFLLSPSDELATAWSLATPGQRTLSVHKVKNTLEQAMWAQKGADIQLYSFWKLGARCGWKVNTTSQPLYPQETHTLPTVKGEDGP
jgi:DICT domain-containing protein